MYVLKNCRLVPELTEDYNSEFADIVIEGQRIVDITGPEKACCSAERVFDAEGCTVMPGMFDLHTHISYTGFGDLHDGGRSEYKILLDTIKHVTDCLNAGFTTLRDAGGKPGLCASVRDAIDDGSLVGPDIKVCGRLMSPTELGNKANKWADETIHEIDSSDSIRKGVREEVRDGADYIKYVASGAVTLKGSNPKIPIATYEEVKKVVEEAAFKGRYVAAHCHDTDSILLCLKAGVYTIEHASLLNDACMEILKEGRQFIVPTISCTGAKLASGEGKPAYAAYMANDTAKQILEGAVKSMVHASEDGLIVGLGTDTGMPNIFHGNNAMELVYRKNLGGLQDAEILKQATIYSALISGEEEDKGTVKSGKLADLIVVDGKPDKDVSCLLDGIKMVIKRGRVVRA